MQWSIFGYKMPDTFKLDVGLAYFQMVSKQNQSEVQFFPLKDVIKEMGIKKMGVLLLNGQGTNLLQNADFEHYKE